MQLDTQKFSTRILLLYGASMMGLIVFLGVSVFLNQSKEAIQMPSDQNWIWLAVIGGVLGVIVGDYLFRTLMSKIPKEATLDQKISKYQVATLVRFGLLEFSALIPIVGYLITGSKILLAFAAIQIGFYLYQRPSRDKIISDLDIPLEDQDKI